MYRFTCKAVADGYVRETLESMEIVRTYELSGANYVMNDSRGKKDSIMERDLGIPQRRFSFMETSAVVFTESAPTETQKNETREALKRYLTSANWKHKAKILAQIETTITGGGVNV